MASGKLSSVLLAVLLATAAPAHAALVELSNLERPSEFRVGLRNFYVITRYNRSALYAAAVTDLAKELRRIYDLGR